MNLKPSSLLSALVIAGGVFLSNVVQAAPLFISPAFSTIATPISNAFCSSCEGNYRVFDRFSLSSDSIITGTEFAIQSVFGSDWNINISIWDSTRTTELYSQTFVPGRYNITYVGNAVNKIYARFTEPRPMLSAGDYWISWFDPVNLGIPGYSAGDDLFSAFSPTNPQEGNPLGLGAAFQICGIQCSPVSDAINVPEPGTIAMLGVGLLGIGLNRRKTVSSRTA